MTRSVAGRVGPGSDGLVWGMSWPCVNKGARRGGMQVVWELGRLATPRQMMAALDCLLQVCCAASAMRAACLRPCLYPITAARAAHVCARRGAPAAPVTCGTLVTRGHGAAAAVGIGVPPVASVQRPVVRRRLGRCRRSGGGPRPRRVPVGHMIAARHAAQARRALSSQDALVRLFSSCE